MPRILQLESGYILHVYITKNEILHYSLIAIEYPDSPLPYPGHNEITRWKGDKVFPYPITGFYTLYSYFPKHKEFRCAITTPEGRFEADKWIGKDNTFDNWIHYQNSLYEYLHEERKEEE